MAIATYLSNDNLHFKPICARIGRGVVQATTYLQNHASQTEWHGHLVRFLSKAVLLAGSIVCIPIALIEAVSLFIIAGLGIALNRLFCQNESEFLQKYSMKALSYAIHSSVVTVALFILGVKNPDLKYYTANALVDHALHIGSAGFTQTIFGSQIDRSVGRDLHLTIERNLNLFRDSHPALLEDVFSQVQRDFELNFRDQIEQLPHLETYLNRHPEDREFIRDFNFQSLLQNQEYRQRAALFVRRYLEVARIVRPAAAPLHPLQLDLNQNTQAEMAYQDHLADLLKDSFLEIHRDDRLAHFLDKDNNNTGKDLLEMLDASIYVPLTTYTLYKELLQPIQCPEPFTGNLAQFNGRRAALLAAKAIVERVDRNLLEEKILRGADFEPPAEVQQAYLAISALAPALYQGPLMTKTSINLEALEGGGANLIDVRNLFQRSCQDAIDEINLAAAGAANAENLV